MTRIRLALKEGDRGARITGRPSGCGRPANDGIGRKADIATSGYSTQKIGMGKATSRIMYIEDKSQGLDGPAKIGRVFFSKTGRSLEHGGRTFQSLKGGGYKANYFDVENGDHFWISGPRRDGRDRLYANSSKPVLIDPDIEEEYWRDIRGKSAS